MKRLATSALVGAVLLAGAVPVGAQEGAPMTMPGGLKVMPDGNDMDWQPAPASLPKGMMITLLAGDPAKPGPLHAAPDHAGQHRDRARTPIRRTRASP